MDLVAWHNILSAFDLPQRQAIETMLVTTFEEVRDLLEEWWQTQATQREGYAQAVRDGVLVPNTSFREWEQRMYGRSQG